MHPVLANNDLPFNLSDEGVPDISIGRRRPSTRVGRAELSEGFFWSLWEQVGEIWKIENHIRHGTLTEVSSGEGRHHKNDRAL